jgi:SNF2 family DNA or RNA helicase
VLFRSSEKNVRFIDATPQFSRYKRLDELKALVAKDVMSVRKEDCLDLPPKVHERIDVDMTEEQARVYKNLKSELIALYEGHELTVANKVALSTRLMQVAGGFFPFYKEGVELRGSERVATRAPDCVAIGDRNSKLEALLEDLEEVPDDQQVIVWAHFVAELKMLHKELSKHWKACLYYGGTAQQDRDKIKEAFVRGEHRIFVGNAQTAGFGLNLQCATLQYFYSNTFRTEDRLQAEDRSHRNGVKGTVVIKDIVARRTLDESILRNILSGRELNDFFKSATLKDLLSEENDEEVKY